MLLKLYPFFSELTINFSNVFTFTMVFKELPTCSLCHWFYLHGRPPLFHPLWSYCLFVMSLFSAHGGFLLSVFLEHTWSQRYSPRVLPAGVLHLLQDSRGQDRWCGAGSALPLPAHHVGVYEEESEPWWLWRLHLHQGCQETSVGCFDQWVRIPVCHPYLWKCSNVDVQNRLLQCIWTLFLKFLSFYHSLLFCSVRNALVVVAASFVAFSWDAYGYNVFTITGETARGLPPFRPPPTTDTTANGTVISFREIVEVSSRDRRSVCVELSLIQSSSLCVLSRALEEVWLWSPSWVCWRVSL